MNIRGRTMAEDKNTVDEISRDPVPSCHTRRWRGIRINLVDGTATMDADLLPFQHTSMSALMLGIRNRRARSGWVDRAENGEKGRREQVRRRLPR